MKVWIKVYQDDKILQSIIIEKNCVITRKAFEDIIRDACHRFDYSTPIILAPHFNHFRDFNFSKFLPEDFIEPVNFTKMTAENCAD